MKAPRLSALLLVALVGLVLAGQATAAPAAPPYLRVSATTAGSITLTWRKPAGAVRYRIYRGGALFRTTTSLGTTLRSIRCGRAYAIAVRAVDRNGGVGPAATRTVRKGTGCIARSRIVRMNATRAWTCTRPLASIAAANGFNGRRGRLPLLVHMRFSTYRNLNPAVVEIAQGCRGDGNANTIDLILRIEGDGRTRGGTVDAIKVRQNPRDIQITGYANCGPRGRGAHQDGAQIQGGTRIEFIDFSWGIWSTRRATCHGANGTFVPGSVNNHPVVDVACIRCKSVSCNHGMYVGESRGTLVQDSRWRTGRPSDRTIRLATGVQGLCDHGGPPCETRGPTNLTVQSNFCDRWPYTRG